MHPIYFRRRTLVSAASVAVLSAVSCLYADTLFVIDLDEPYLDRWFYPFNTSPGSKPDAPIFGGIVDQEIGFDPGFDNRDGQLLVGFQTDAIVPTGLGEENYYVTSAVVTVMIKDDLAFAYDPSQDSWTTWLPSNDPNFEADGDLGRPVELWGTGFRYNWEATTFPEDGPFCNGCSCFPNPKIFCKMVRSAFPIDLIGAGCTGRDVSNFVDEMFDPDPFAVGFIPGFIQGQLVPFNTEMQFVLDVTDPCVRDYLAEGLNVGMLDFVVASVFVAEEQQAGDFPRIFCKEDPLVAVGLASATRLDMQVSTLLGDLNGDGFVDTVDFLDLLSKWGPCPGACPPLCSGDLNGDCQVDTIDFLALLANWG